MEYSESYTYIATGLKQQGYSQNEIDEIYIEFNSTYDNYDKFEYTNNLRIARAGNTDDVRQYKRQLKHGCCGQYDTMLIIETNNDIEIILFGFNYGH